MADSKEGLEVSYRGVQCGTAVILCLTAIFIRIQLRRKTAKIEHEERTHGSTCREYTVMISGLPRDRATSAESIREIFQEWGEIAHIAVAFDIAKLWRKLRARERLRRAFEDDRQWSAGARDRPRRVRVAADAAAVDLGDDVAGPHATRLRGAAGLDARDDGRARRFALGDREAECALARKDGRVEGGHRLWMRGGTFGLRAARAVY